MMQDMTNTTSSRKRTGAVAHPRITWTAAMLAMLAGAPMGLAQEDGDNPAAGFASLMNMFSGQEGEEGQDGQASRRPERRSGGPMVSTTTPT